VTREEMGKLVFAAVYARGFDVEWATASEDIRERCMLAAEAVDRASRRDERGRLATMLRVAGAEQRVIADMKSPGLINAAELVETVAALAPMLEARKTEGVE
jgi:hypothetical protein